MEVPKHPSIFVRYQKMRGPATKVMQNSNLIELLRNQTVTFPQRRPSLLGKPERGALREAIAAYITFGMDSPKLYVLARSEMR